MSEESENKHSTKEIWQSTFATFFSKFIFALTFVIPVLLFELTTAIIVSVLWGFLLLTIFSYRMAISQKANPLKVIGEHLLIALVVITATHFVGSWIGSVFS
jgi:VIT1/CCC1 family predicted Fe2+/Mn2+ transporter